MSLVVYGASDDLVEVEGDIREEFNQSMFEDETANYLAVSDGTVLRISYDGIWHIARVAEGAAEYAHEPATAEEGTREDGTPAYSDRVTLTGMGDLPLAWVVFGDRFEVS